MIELIAMVVLVVLYGACVTWAWYRFCESNLQVPDPTGLSQMRTAVWAAVVGGTTLVCLIGLTLRAIEIIKPWLMR